MIHDFALRAGFAALGLGGCQGDTFECQTDGQCVAMSGEVGECRDGACAFPDGRCPSGLRYGSHAAPGLAGQCVPIESEGATATTTPDPSSTATAAMTTVTSAPGTASSSGPPAIESSSGPVASTGLSASTGTPDDTGLVFHYTCDEIVDGVMTDASGNGHDAKCSDCPTIDTGPVGSACVFGGGSRFTVEDSAELNNQEFTIALWAQRAATPMGNGMAFSKPLGKELKGSFEFLTVGQADMTVDMFFCYGDLKSDACAITREIPTDVFVHFAAVFDGASAVFYIDAVPTTVGGVAANGIGYDDQAWIIGGDLDFGLEDNPFDGSIDEVRLYNRRLTAFEIAELATPL